MQCGVSVCVDGPQCLGTTQRTTKAQEDMAMTTSPYASDALPGGTVDAVVIGGGAAGLNGALTLARARRSVVVIDSGSPRNAPAAAMHGFIVLDGHPPRAIPPGGPEQ